MSGCYCENTWDNGYSHIVFAGKALNKFKLLSVFCCAYEPWCEAGSEREGVAKGKQQTFTRASMCGLAGAITIPCLAKAHRLQGNAKASKNQLDGRLFGLSAPPAA